MLCLISDLPLRLHEFMYSEKIEQGLGKKRTPGEEEGLGSPLLDAFSGLTPG